MTLASDEISGSGIRSQRNFRLRMSPSCIMIPLTSSIMMPVLLPGVVQLTVLQNDLTSTITIILNCIYFVLLQEYRPDPITPIGIDRNSNSALSILSEEDSVAL